MSEAPGDGADVGAVGDQVGGGRVTQVVKTNAFESVSIGEDPPILGDLVERDRVAPVPSAAARK